jgi:hypothetical protein
MMTTRIQSILQKECDRWNDCHDLSQINLLRLGLLRELIQVLHSEKSRCLAEGRKENAQEIRDLESKVECLRDFNNLQGDLIQMIYKSSGEATRKKRLIPESLYLHLDRAKLERYDRKWECAIAAEAIALNWKFWYLDSWVKISGIEEWNKSLMDRLWPHGLVLFTESASTQNNEIIQEMGNVPLWHGHWIIVLDTQLKHPTELSLHLNHWPGSPEEPPTPAQWKSLYP